jgi:hypothetical protein
VATTKGTEPDKSKVMIKEARKKQTTPLISIKNYFKKKEQKLHTIITSRGDRV